MEASFPPAQQECLAWLRAQAAALDANGAPYPTKLDALTAVLESIPGLQFEEHERDMCAQQHELEILWTESAARDAGLEWPWVAEESSGGGGGSGLMLERRVSRMIAFGSDEKDGECRHATRRANDSSACHCFLLRLLGPQQQGHVAGTYAWADNSVIVVLCCVAGRLV